MKAAKTTFLLIVHAIILASTASFCPHFPQHTRIRRTPRPSLNLVTEQDVLALVEKAEELWAEAYEARKTANELSERAESLGKDAELSAATSARALKESISEKNIEEASNAQNLSLELGSLLDEVVEAERKADEIEEKAEEALRASEVALEQHLIDFPENA
ncbi:hypothetical protein HJC23_013709 [Cyclotella cryptica]|uniref:Uncharacterized protein n=1 Tax=Cyclotella cryptica TaxID=29204 RepID=A0ABD3QV00_9STRA|eukprot:CCRYP_001571-RA/>CCRYP_001571-RA protein AED:0.03 eAED:0.02 QI:0/-1/0/1/-1/1/1/0/160